MADDSTVIQQQMEETRSAMNDKLEALESKVADTVQSTTEVVQASTEAVSNTVESVKETVAAVTNKVQETVKSIGNTFNLSLQMERHPWLIFGGSVALGMFGSWLMSSRDRRPESREPPEPAKPEPAKPEQPTESKKPVKNGSHGANRIAFSESSPPTPPKPTTTDWIGEQFGRLKGLAVGSLMGAVRDMAKISLPPAIGERVAEEVDSLTSHMGGEPIHGSVLTTK